MMPRAAWKPGPARSPHISTGLQDAQDCDLQSCACIFLGLILSILLSCLRNPETGGLRVRRLVRSFCASLSLAGNCFEVEDCIALERRGELPLAAASNFLAGRGGVI